MVIKRTDTWRSIHPRAVLLLQVIGKQGLSALVSITTNIIQSSSYCHSPGRKQISPCISVIQYFSLFHDPKLHCERHVISEIIPGSPEAWVRIPVTEGFLFACCIGPKQPNFCFTDLLQSYHIIFISYDLLSDYL